jgi:aspartate kinase
MQFPFVMKFGGAGLCDGSAVIRACDIISGHAEQNLIVVVSAHAGVTESLHRCAQEAAQGRVSLEALRIRHRGLLRQLGLDPELLDRLLGELGQVLYGLCGRPALAAEELDFVLSFGERMSARIVAASLRRRGLVATPVDAFDLGLTTDSCYGRARPLPGVEASLRRSLDDIPGLPIVTGFLAKDDRGNLTTMGRNGSDLTAALVARAVGARRLVFWKSVPGVMTADPALVPEARVIETLSFAAAEALAFHGADVLHPSTLEPVRDAELTVEVRDGRAPERPGTRLEKGSVTTGPVAIAGSAELAGLRVATDAGALPNALFALLHAHDVRPRYLHSGPEGVTVFAPKSTSLDILQRELSARATPLPSLASVVVIGGEASSGWRALELCLARGLVPTRLQIGGGCTSQVFLFEPELRERALRMLHEELLTRTPAPRIETL